MRTRRAAAVVSAVLLLAACSEEVQGVSSPGDPAPPSSSSPEPAPPSEEQPDDPGSGTGTDTEDKSGPGTGTGGTSGQPAVAGINFRSDESTATLVVNLSGDGVPEWTVAYSEATAPDGSAVDIAGDAFLRVRVRSDAGGGQGSSRFSISPGPVAEARTTGAADGYEEVLIGVRGGEQPFTVDALSDPARLVVEVRTAG
ncbi:hypothetical protein ACI78T_02195 [Blastococcus sp. SYSU D00922]